MAITFNDSIDLKAPKALDSRYAVYESGQTRSYNNTLEVFNKLDLSVRHKGLTVIIDSDEYWFKDGILDNNLVIKTNNINTSNFVTLNTEQTITGLKSFTSPLNLQSDLGITGNIYSTANIFTRGTVVFNRDENDTRYIIASPNTPQIANISLNGTISNTGFQVQANGQTFWRNAANTAFIANVSDTNGLSLYNRPINLFGTTSQKMQLRNDDTGLVISNTANQTKFKISDLGTVSLLQTPSAGGISNQVLTRNPVTGNIELGSTSSGNFVDLTSDQSIAGNKSFSSISDSTITGNLNLTSGSIQDSTKSNQVAYWDELGFLTNIDIPTYTFNNGLVSDENNLVGLKGNADWTFDSYVTIGEFGKTILYLADGIAKLQSGLNQINVFKDNGIELFTYDAEGTQLNSIILNRELLQIRDGINLKGIEYAGDYSANYTARSLVDKGYVDNRFVDLTTNQTINGIKAFESPIFENYGGITSSVINTHLSINQPTPGVNDLSGGISFYTRYSTDTVNTGNVNLYAKHQTAFNREIYLPDKSGEVALVADLPKVFKQLDEPSVSKDGDIWLVKAP